MGDGEGILALVECSAKKGSLTPQPPLLTCKERKSGEGEFRREELAFVADEFDGLGEVVGDMPDF